MTENEINDLIEKSQRGEQFTPEEVTLYSCELIRALKEDEPKIYDNDSVEVNPGVQMWTHLQTNMTNLMLIHSNVRSTFCEFIDGKMDK